MFDFKVEQPNPNLTVAKLGDYTVRFGASHRNTRINCSVLVDADELEYRSSACKFYHFDTSYIGDGSPNVVGGNDRDCGGSAHDITFYA